MMDPRDIKEVSLGILESWGAMSPQNGDLDDDGEYWEACMSSPRNEPGETVK